MRFPDKVDHMLRQYRYKKQRSDGRTKNDSNLNIGDYLDEVESYIDGVIKEIDGYFS